MLMMMLMMNFPPKNIAFLRWWIHCSRNANKMNDEWRCKREKTAGADRRKRPCLSWLPKLQHISMFLWTDGMEKRKGKSRRRSHTSMTSAYDTTRRKQHNREASRVIHPNGFSYGKMMDAEWYRHQFNVILLDDCVCVSCSFFWHDNERNNVAANTLEPPIHAYTFTY